MGLFGSNPRRELTQTRSQHALLERVIRLALYIMANMVKNTFKRGTTNGVKSLLKKKRALIAVKSTIKNFKDKIVSESDCHQCGKPFMVCYC